MQSGFSSSLKAAFIVAAQLTRRPFPLYDGRDSKNLMYWISISGIWISIFPSYLLGTADLILLTEEKGLEIARRTMKITIPKNR